MNCSIIETNNKKSESIASNSEAKEAPEKAKPEAGVSNTEEDKIDGGGTEKMDDSVAPDGGKANDVSAVVHDAEVAQESKSPNKRKADERNDRGSKRHRDR